MNVEEIIERFLAYTLDHEEPVDDLGPLISLLDELAYCAGTLQPTCDDTKHPHPPRGDYHDIRQKVGKRFRTLGLYNIALDISDKVGDSEIATGDAIDDLADIAIDLQQVMWCFHNTSSAHGLWYYAFMYKAHWGKHLRELQLCLHDMTSK